MVEADAVRLVQHRVDGFAAVAPEPFLAIARYGADDAGLRVDFANAMIECVRKVQVSSFVERHVERLVELGLHPGATVAREAFLARADR